MFTRFELPAAELLFTVHIQQPTVVVASVNSKDRHLPTKHLPLAGLLFVALRWTLGAQDKSIDYLRRANDAYDREALDSALTNYSNRSIELAPQQTAALPLLLTFVRKHHSQQQPAAH